ncbi:MAG: hypothetical protein HRU06_19200 [Oceanospirillaceae bacterium]|nr:hypothetical protein [Oceanospirillaceae bacterium]
MQSATSSANLKAFKASRNIAVLTSTNAMSYIRQPNVKLLVVLFSTFDKSCKTCANANRNFYALAKQHKDINFAFVNTQPWRAKELESVLFFRLSNTKPVSLIFHNTKVLRKLVGANYQKMPGYLKAARNIITSGHLPMYGNKLANGSFSAVVISDQYQAFLTKYLNNEKNYKALAVALGKRQKWTASQKVGYLSQADANNQALSQCNQRWKSKGNRGACQLYMVGDEYVYGKSGPQIKAITAAIKNKQTPLDKYVLKLKPLKNNKALAYAVNKNGSWTSSYVFNHSSVRSATKAVLASCEKRRLQKNMSSPCSLYYVNDRKL